MRSHHFLRARFPLFLCSVLPLSIFAGAPEADKPSYEAPQPSKESVGYTLAACLRTVEILLLLEIRLTIACGTSRVEPAVVRGAWCGGEGDW